jgi:hypothetical protein
MEGSYSIVPGRTEGQVESLRVEVTRSGSVRVSGTVLISGRKKKISVNLAPEVASKLTGDMAAAVEPAAKVRLPAKGKSNRNNQAKG